jgi:hypothetical protein
LCITGVQDKKFWKKFKEICGTLFRRVHKIAKSELLTLSCMPVCLSICPHKKLGSHWTDFHEILYLNIFRKFLEKFQVLLKSNKNALHEDHYTSVITSRPFLLKMRNVSGQNCRKIKTHLKSSNSFLKKILPILWKNTVNSEGHRWKYDVCAFHAGYLRLQTQTQNM